MMLKLTKKKKKFLKRGFKVFCFIKEPSVFKITLVTRDWKNNGFIIVIITEMRVK